MWVHYEFSDQPVQRVKPGAQTHTWETTRCLRITVSAEQDEDTINIPLDMLKQELERLAMMRIPYENLARPSIDKLVMDILHHTHEDHNNDITSWQTAELKARQLVSLLADVQERIQQRGLQPSLPFEKED